MPLGPEDPPEKASDLEPLFKSWGLRMVPEQVLGDGSYAMSVSVGAEQRKVRHLGWMSLPRAALGSELFLRNWWLRKIRKSR